MTYFNAQGQGRVGWRSLVVTQVVNAVDADAQSFISAAGITNLTQASAVNTLVNDLKTYGLWTKMKALYPMVGGTATTHKFNLKDPRDLDAAYRLGFGGGWTHSSTGALPNGTNAYANTYLHTSLRLTPNNLSIGLYTNTNRAADTSPSKTAYGNSDNVTTYTPITQFYLRANNGNLISDLGNYNFGRISGANTSTAGFYVNTRTANNSMKVFKNNTLFGSSTTTNPTNTLPNSNLYFAAFNNAGSYVDGYETINFQFFYASDGLSDTEAANFYNSVQKFQTTLGRQIGSPIVSDTDAQAFINSAGLTDLGQANAVNTLVVDLKAAGVWTKMKALYPFVGGTATTHKWNLKDPRDLNEAFRLVFTGGWTHTSTGALPNGSNGYANTYLVPSNNFPISQYDAHISLYSRTNIEAPTTNWLSGSIGVDDDYNSAAYFILNVNSKTTRIVQGRTLGNQWTTYSGPLDDSRGFFIINKQNNTTLKLKKNDTLLSSNTTLSTAQYRPAQNFYIGAVNGSQSYSGLNYDNKEYGFISIGNGLTDTEASAFYTAVQKYQTSLGRQVGTPVLAEGQTAGLLETYSGAAAAYSLRKLRNGYVGNAIRVRRSSDNTEQDIAFDASGNLDTTSLLAFVGSGNGFVTTWYDQSGFNNHITQTTAGNQPQIVSSGVVKLLNNKPSIYFDGSSTYFNSSTQTVLSTGGGGYSIFGTAKPSGTSGPKCLFYIGSASGNNGVGFNLSNTQPRHYWFANDYDTSQTFSDTNAIYAVSYDGSKRYTAINNVTQSQNATGKNTISPILMVGKLQGYGQTFIGLQSELIIYNSYKDTSITSIYGSMNSYYSIY